MAIQTRSKLTAQLKDIEDLLVRFRDKCASDIRATGLAATGDKGAQEGLARGRKAEDRLRSSIESSCLDVLLLQQPLIGDDMRFVTGAFRIVSDLSHIDGMTRATRASSQPRFPRRQRPSSAPSSLRWRTSRRRWSRRPWTPSATLIPPPHRR